MMLTEVLQPGQVLVISSLLSFLTPLLQINKNPLRSFSKRMLEILQQVTKPRSI